MLWNFNIADEAGGSGRPLICNFTTNVTAHTLEIEFYWAGKGTTSAPDRGVYGPLISAITVMPSMIVTPVCLPVAKVAWVVKF